MFRSIAMPAAALAAAAFLPPLGGYAVMAQSAPLYVSAVDLQIAPGSMKKFLAALNADGAAMIKEPGAREFDSAVDQKASNHVFIFEVYNDAAAYDAHQKTAAYDKFVMGAMGMLTHYNIRPFSSVAMNANGAAQPASGPFFVNKVELDIVPAQFDQFMDAAKTNAAASVKDNGCREFDIAVSQGEPHHVLFLEIYDNAAALQAHEATDHFKTYQTTTDKMVAKRVTQQLSSVQMETKGQ